MAKPSPQPIDPACVADLALGTDNGPRRPLRGGRSRLLVRPRGTAENQEGDESEELFGDVLQAHSVSLGRRI